MKKATKKKPATKTAAKKKIGTMGSKIMAEAKKIRKANPRKKWTTCVKEGAKKLKKK